MTAYEYTDKIIAGMNRKYLRLFSRLKILSIDELNVMQSVSQVFDSSVRIAKAAYLDIAEFYYAFFLKKANERSDGGRDGSERDFFRLAVRRRGEPDGTHFTQEQIDEVLDEYDPVTKYRFFSEVERKRQRLIEAIIASKSAAYPSNARKNAKYSGVNYEVSRALRNWSLQSAQYAIKITDFATLQSYLDAGIEKVRWVTQEDGKVCVQCGALDGMVFEIISVPPKPHYNCRCWLESV